MQKKGTPARWSLLLAGLLVAAGNGFAEAVSPLVDDFGHAEYNSLGNARLFINDSSSGGGTSTKQSVANGILSVSGGIRPPRGQPGWASTVLLLDPEGRPRDVSAYQGVRLLVRLNTGALSVSANSTDVTNYDYHAAPISVTADGTFHEVKIPFGSMKRAWSEQTPLNTTTIASLSIVAYAMQPGDVDFQLDEVAFY
jgi:hypothetical protein